MHARSVTSNSLRPYGLQPARLLCAWDSPGNNTRVGCHFLLLGMFLTQELNRGLLQLPDWQVGSSITEPQGKPISIANSGKIDIKTGITGVMAVVLVLSIKCLNITLKCGEILDRKYLTISFTGIQLFYNILLFPKRFKNVLLGALHTFLSSDSLIMNKNQQFYRKRT